MLEGKPIRVSPKVLSVFALGFAVSTLHMLSSSFFPLCRFYCALNDWYIPKVLGECWGMCLFGQVVVGAVLWL